MDYSGMYRHPIPSVRRWTRKQWREVGRPTWKNLRDVGQDELAYRELILRIHGLETLQNVIAGHHGLPNRY